MNALPVTQVQHFLNMLEPEQSFTVIFLTNSGEQRAYTGTLLPSTSKRDLVAFQTDAGIKSFKIDKVLSIELDYANAIA